MEIKSLGLGKTYRVYIHLFEIRDYEQRLDKDAPFTSQSLDQKSNG